MEWWVILIVWIAVSFIAGFTVARMFKNNDFIDHDPD
jgi:putative solute:sodium symporter small subunit